MIDAARVGRAVAALATLGLALALVATMPSGIPLPEGWSVPILCLEFARSPQDLTWLTGPDAAGIRAALRAGQRLDVLFPVAYAAVLVGWGWILARDTPVAWAVAGLGAMACPLDWWENAILERILREAEAGTVPVEALDALHRATSLKWAAIGLAAAAMVGSTPRRGVQLAAGAVALVTAVALGTRWPAADEWMGLAVNVWFTVLIAISLVDARSRGQEPAGR